MEAIKNRIRDAQVSLENGQNQREFDLFVKGMIRAFRETLALQPDVVLEEPFEDESDV